MEKDLEVNNVEETSSTINNETEVKEEVNNKEEMLSKKDANALCKMELASTSGEEARREAEGAETLASAFELLIEAALGERGKAVVGPKTKNCDFATTCRFDSIGKNFFVEREGGDA